MKSTKVLLRPSTYRLPEYQDAWLREQAAQAGYTDKVNILRQLIDRAMQKKGKV